MDKNLVEKYTIEEYLNLLEKQEEIKFFKACKNNY